MDNTLTPRVEELQNMNSKRKRGGWISFPFIIGSGAGMTFAVTGILGNLIVYLINEFNIKSVTAVEVGNLANGITALFPFFAATTADSIFGSFAVALFSSFVSLLGAVILVLTSTMKSLKPDPCNSNVSNQCNSPSKFQYTVLYGGIMLSAIGFGCARFTTSALGANQFDEEKQQETFFRWLFCTWFVFATICYTGLFYIQDNVSWALGFGLCAVTAFISLVILLSGYRFYRHEKPHGSAFKDLARVLVASFRKRKLQLSSTSKVYYSGVDGTVEGEPHATPGKRLRFFNRAALITEGDFQSNGLVEKQWRLCTVQQVEDFKSVTGVLPIFVSGIFLSLPIGIQGSMSTLQALVTDRHIGPNFKIPAGSITFIPMIFASIYIVIDRVISFAWKKLTSKSPTIFQRIGLGHVFNVVGMVVSALVESKRLKIAHSNPTMLMSVLWLFPQLAFVGMGEALHFPAQITFYYQQFPQSLRSTGTTMTALIIGTSFNLGTAVINQVHVSTDWLPNDLNNGRLDKFYWMLAVIGSINFVYFLICASLYKRAEV